VIVRPLVAFEEGRMVLPGFVSAHSHAFQRALRGKTQRASRETGTFWSWREAMYRLAEALTPESIARISRMAFDELRRAGVVAVGEFHYVHHQPGGVPYDDRLCLADAVIRAALDAGLRITLLRVAYARSAAGRPPEGVQRRFSDPDVDHVLRDVGELSKRWAQEPRVKVGLAPHSLRAVPGDWLGPLHAWARERSMPFHMHVAEVQGEVDACLAEHGLRPVEFLAERGVLDARFVGVHCTNLLPHEARLLGEAKAFACVCPTTERDLGDGLGDLSALRAAGVRLCTGVDSHVVTDPVEEARALETHERLRLRRRVTFDPAPRTPAEQLLVDASVHGAQACGWDVTLDGAQTSWAPSTRIDLGARALAGVSREELLDALFFSGSAACVAFDGAPSEESP
jgi:formiminoglutamate deiminase